MQLSFAFLDVISKTILDDRASPLKSSAECSTLHITRNADNLHLTGILLFVIKCNGWNNYVKFKMSLLSLMLCCAAISLPQQCFELRFQTSLVMKRIPKLLNHIRCWYSKKQNLFLLNPQWWPFLVETIGNRFIFCTIKAKIIIDSKKHCLQSIISGQSNFTIINHWWLKLPVYIYDNGIAIHVRSLLGEPNLSMGRMIKKWVWQM